MDSGAGQSRIPLLSVYCQTLPWTPLLHFKSRDNMCPLRTASHHSTSSPFLESCLSSIYSGHQRQNNLSEMKIWSWVLFLVFPLPIPNSKLLRFSTILSRPFETWSSFTSSASPQTLYLVVFALWNFSISFITLPSEIQRVPRAPRIVFQPQKCEPCAWKLEGQGRL